MREAGFELVNLCPRYAPIHVHKSPSREARVRINAGGNSLVSATDADLDKYCTFS